MAEAITKTAITKAVVAKSGAGLTWDEATMSWDTMEGTWDLPGQLKTVLTKSSVTKAVVTKS